MLILEFNNKDKEVIKTIGDSFTIALEFELETEDTSNPDESISPAKFIKIVKENTTRYINDEYKGEKDKMFVLVDEILSSLDFGDDEDNIEILDEYLDEYNKGFENKLIQVILSDYMTYIISDNVEYLTDKLKENLPIFFRKWDNQLKYELDNTLNRGIEFSMKTYLDGIDKTIELIKDFYSEFNKQDYWQMNKRTGIHINIGFNHKVDWNILKGVLMISDVGEESFTFKNMEWREKSFYTKSIIPHLKSEIESDKPKVMKHSHFQDLKKMEDYFGSYILSIMKKQGYKNFGFNLTRIGDYNYVEFRYPGGEITEQTLVDKVYYFCYISYLMTNKSFKRKEYLKKLYKFISTI